MHTEFRILEVRRGHVWAQPLDAVKRESLRIASSSKYIENEVIVAEPISGGPGVPSRWQVIAAQVDPSFIGGEAPKLAAIDEKNEENEYEFTKYVGYDEGEDFEDALETLRSGHYETAAHLLRAFIKRFPYHIDSYHHLGIIETDLGHRDRALKFFEMGYHIGIRSIPENFSGRLRWIHLENRLFLRAAHGYGLALEQQRRQLEAVDVYEQILSLNPDDNQGIRYLLPSLYLEAQAPQKARAALDQYGADGMNLYTRCLLEIQDGRRWEAVRWLCRGLTYNRTAVATGGYDAMNKFAVAVLPWYDRWLLCPNVQTQIRFLLSRTMTTKAFCHKDRPNLSLVADDIVPQHFSSIRDSVSSRRSRTDCPIPARHPIAKPEPGPAYLAADQFLVDSSGMTTPERQDGWYVAAGW